MKANEKCCLFTLLSAAAVALVWSMLAVQPAAAGGTVTTCTEAGLDAALAGGGSISFNCGGVGSPATIIISNSKQINLATAIDGRGVITFTSSASNFDGIFEVMSAGHLSLSNLTLNKGQRASGSALYNQHALTLSNVTLLDNGFVSGGEGGAIFNLGILTITGTRFFNNHSGSGGAIYNGSDARLTIVNSVFISNALTVGNGGGAIENGGGTVFISGSTFLSNTSPYLGGAIDNQAIPALLVVADSTFGGNRATGANSFGGAISSNSGLSIANSSFFGNHAAAGGALYMSGGFSATTILNSSFYNNNAKNGGAIQSGGNLYVTNSTLSANVANGSGFDGKGGAVLSTGGIITISNSSLVSNTGSSGGTIYGSTEVRLRNSLAATGGPTNCALALTSLGHNLADDDSCGLGASGDLTDTNPLVGPLQNNGGGTLTHQLLPGSPAIDAGDDGSCPPTDQRGVLRPQGAHCDIGAYELVPNQAQTISFALLPDRALSESPFTLSATASSGLAVTFTASGACTLSGNSVSLTGLGLCSITAHQAGNGTFMAAPDVVRTFKVIVKLFLPLLVR